MLGRREGQDGREGLERAMTRQMARFDQFEVDFRSRELRKGGVRVRLQDQPFHILSMLLDAGANPDFKNKLGGTAMMWAASYGQDEAVRILLNRGADPRIKDVDGVTAAGWAAKNGQGGLVMLLHEAEKRKQFRVRSKG